MCHQSSPNKSFRISIIFVLLVLCNLSVGAGGVSSKDHYEKKIDAALDRALREWDTNSNGKIDFDEFESVYDAIFGHDSHSDHGDEHEHGEDSHDEHDGDHDNDGSHDEDHDEHDEHSEDSHDEHDEDHDDENEGHHDEHDEDHDDHGEHDEDHEGEDSHDEHDEDHDDEHEGHHDEHDEDHDESGTVIHSVKVEVELPEGECFPEDDIFEAYDTNGDGDWDAIELSPAMHEILLMVFHGCAEGEDEHAHDHGGDCSKPKTWESWLYAMISTLVISLASLLGILIIPVRLKIFKKVLLELLVAFAVGTLVGSAILELIPAAFELHSHGEEAEEEEVDERNYIWGGAAVCAGVLFFFVLERVIALIFTIVLHFWDKYHKKPEEDLETGEEPVKAIGGHSHGGVDMFSGGKKRLKAVGILNLVSDGVHNFIDGLAIGVAWRTDLGTGLATSLAILFHEIPQEFGDFAILIYAGFKKWQALLFNLFSACLAFLGTTIGLLVGGAAQDADRWILAVTAGGFLYIALVDMLAEIKDIKGIGHSIAQFFGILLGMGIMLIIAVFEEDLGGCYSH